MGVIVPRKFFLTSGIGRSEDQLFSFELALRDAGVEGANFVFVSSICPPACIEVMLQGGVKELGIRRQYQGGIVYAVCSRIDVLGLINPVVVSASVAYARPTDKNHHGYFTEYHGYEDIGSIEAKAVHYATKMLKSKKLIVEKTNAVSVSAQTIPGEWLTAIALAVFID
mgnify:CR=1 FL=1